MVSRQPESEKITNVDQDYGDHGDEVMHLGYLSPGLTANAGKPIYPWAQASCIYTEYLS